MKFFSVKLILLFLSIEILLRVWSFFVPNWYQQAVHDMRQTPVRYIFIGSSRTACSIDTNDFAQAMALPPASVINMGSGDSTLMAHYFGLRRIAAAKPGNLQGVTVFLEAPDGMPGLETWGNNWSHPHGSALLVNTIGLADLRSFWAKSDSDFNLKLTVTAATLSETIAMQGNGKTVLANIKKMMRRDQRVAAGKADISDAGGVRNDIAGIQNARRLALDLAADSLRHESLFPRQRGDETVLKSLNNLVNASGGKLVLYRMPVSSVQKQAYTSVTGHENRTVANDLLRSWAIPMLVPAITTNDDDFPDYWHLRKSRSSEFTRSLAQAFLESGKTL